MILGDESTEATVTVGNSKINERNYEKLFGVTFDKKLSFKEHVQDLYKNGHPKASCAGILVLNLSNQKFE